MYCLWNSLISLLIEWYGMLRHKDGRACVENLWERWQFWQHLLVRIPLPHQVLSLDWLDICLLIIINENFKFTFHWFPVYRKFSASLCKISAVMPVKIQIIAIKDSIMLEKQKHNCVSLEMFSRWITISVCKLVSLPKLDLYPDANQNVQVWAICTFPLYIRSAPGYNFHNMFVFGQCPAFCFRMSFGQKYLSTTIVCLLAQIFHAVLKFSVVKNSLKSKDSCMYIVQFSKVWHSVKMSLLSHFVVF